MARKLKVLSQLTLSCYNTNRLSSIRVGFKVHGLMSRLVLLVTYIYLSSVDVRPTSGAVYI